MKKVNWAEVLRSFRHRAGVYSDDAVEAKNDVYAAFLDGKSEGYADIAQGIVTVRKHRASLKDILGSLKNRHRRAMKQSARLADDPIESASLEGFAQANREAVRDILAAAGKLPYAEL